jgi:hypothetical protein
MAQEDATEEACSCTLLAIKKASLAYPFENIGRLPNQINRSCRRYHIGSDQPVNETRRIMKYWARRPQLKCLALFVSKVRLINMKKTTAELG